MPATATIAAPQSQPEWFASWFDSPHYHRLYAHRDESEAVAFVDRLIRQLEPRDGAAVLDLGCGSGRHSRGLAARGFRVTGIDLSAESLERARRRPGPYVRFVEQDMRRPFGTRTFDCVLSLFTSFGYFEDRMDHLTVIRNIATSLKPGGTVVLDYLNVDHVQKHLVAHETIERDGVCYTLSRWSDDRAFFKRISIADGPGRPTVEHVERVAKLTLGDFQRLFGLCGLQIEEAYGDYELGRFEAATSPRLIVVAAKIADRIHTLPWKAKTPPSWLASTAMRKRNARAHERSTSSATASDQLRPHRFGCAVGGKESLDP